MPEATFLWVYLFDAIDSYDVLIFLMLRSCNLTQLAFSPFLLTSAIFTKGIVQEEEEECSSNGARS